MLSHEHVMQKIKLLALDVDGVLTDGRVTYGNSGEEIKSFNIKDGLGIKLLQQSGIEVAIITGRTSQLLERRAIELGIAAVIQGREDKLAALTELAQARDFGLEETAYMGDDLPDMAAIIAAGFGACPSDAVEDIRDAADWLATARGGHGAVRELAELMLRSRGEWSQIIKNYQP